MELLPLEFSVVVVASDCNPTILNPDFLARQHIVPDDWGWKVLAGLAITTPAFAQVSYDSGVTVSVEQSKFQVVEALKETLPDKSRSTEIARQYVKVLPHVRYSAVGHNFKALVERTSVEAFLKERFLKSGAWDGDKHTLDAISLKFSYSLPGYRLIMALDGIIIEVSAGDGSKRLEGVLVHGNYHRDCEGYPSNEQVIAHLNHVTEDWHHFQATASEILG